MHETAYICSRGEASLAGLSVSGQTTIEVRQGSASLSGTLGDQVTVSCSQEHLRLAMADAQSSYDIALTVFQIAF